MQLHVSGRLVRDPQSKTGSGSVATYLNKEGAPQASITVMVNRLMAMTDRQAAPRPKSNGQRRRPADTPAGPPGLPPIEAYNDPIPF